MTEDLQEWLVSNIARDMCRTSPCELSEAEEQLRGRVLVAEDEFLIAMMLEDYLVDDGFEVTVAHDGIEALEAMLAGPFDVLVTDMRMPRLDGAGLIRRVRAIHPDMPVVILTSHAPPSWQALSADAPTVLMEKPLAMPALAAQLRHMIEATRQRWQ
jgi:CheY-like chemotaxis protein